METSHSIPKILTVVYMSSSTPADNKGSYGTVPDIDPAALNAAKSYVASKIPGAIDYSKEKLAEAKKYVEEGDWTWRIAGLCAGGALVFVNLTSVIGNFFTLSLVTAVLNAYLILFGLLMMILEYKNVFLTDKYLRIIKREALFLYRPQGRAAMYFFLGSLETVLGGLLGYIVGFFTMFVGAYVYYSSRQAFLALKDLKSGKYTVDEIKAKFKQEDADNSGYLDSTELASLCDHMGHKLNRHELESALFLLDNNRDGKITLEEFLEWWGDHEDETCF